MQLRPAKNPVQVGAADRTLALSHPGALVIDMDLTRGLPLRLALHTVELTTVGLCHDSPRSMIPANRPSPAEPLAVGYLRLTHRLIAGNSTQAGSGHAGPTPRSAK